MNSFLFPLFHLNDRVAAFLQKRLLSIKKFLLLIAHLSLFGFFFPDLRKDFGEAAFYLLCFLLFLSPISKIFRMRILILLMGFRRQFGIMFAYLASVHGLGYLLDPDWFDFAIRYFFPHDIPGIEPRLIAGFLAYLLTLPLLLTSNNFANRFLGANWKRLHRIVYLVFAFVVFHKFLSSSPGKEGEEYVEAILFIGLYLLLKLLAWKNFLPPLQKLIENMDSCYQAYQRARAAEAPPRGPQL